MKTKTTQEDYLWDLKKTIIAAIPPFLVACIALATLFSFKEFASNSYYLWSFVFVLMLILCFIEITRLGSKTKRKKSKKKVKE